MVLLKAIAALAFLTVFHRVVAEEHLNTATNVELLKWKFDIIIEQSEATANAVRNITIHTPACKVRLTSIVSSFLADIYYIITNFNAAIPNIADDKVQKLVLNITQESSNFANSFQLLLHGDSEQLKEKFALALNEFKDSLLDFEQKAKFDNDFGFLTIDYAADILLYGLYKVKYQSLYFDVTNKQLEPKITEGINEMSKALTALQAIGQSAAVNIRHLFILIQSITHRAINQMESWLELNPTNTEGVEIVEKVIKGLSEIYLKESNAILHLKTVAELKTELSTIYVNGSKKVQKLAHVEYLENHGGQEYIRDVLFECLSLSGAFVENVSKVPNI